MSVGFIGLGNMGLPMAANLLRAGIPLAVWNRSPEKCAGLAASGADINDPSHRIARRHGRERFLDDEFRFGARDQDGRSHVKVEAPEFLVADDVRHRLACDPPHDEILEQPVERGGQGIAGSDQERRAIAIEHVPREHFADALRGLRAQLREGGHLVLFVTRRNPFTRVLIGRWWQSNVYTLEELRESFSQAGFSAIAFRRFPFLFSYLNTWDYIVEAS